MFGESHDYHVTHHGSCGRLYVSEDRLTPEAKQQLTGGDTKVALRPYLSVVSDLEEIISSSNGKIWVKAHTQDVIKLLIGQWVLQLWFVLARSIFPSCEGSLSHTADEGTQEPH